MKLLVRSVQSVRIANTQQPGIWKGERFRRVTKSRRTKRWKRKIRPWIATIHNTKHMIWRSDVYLVCSLGTCPKTFPAAKHEFIEYLGSGAGMQKTDPVFQLREIAQDCRRKRHLLPRRQTDGFDNQGVECSPTRVARATSRISRDWQAH